MNPSCVRRGSILIVVLAVLIVLTSIALSFAYAMRTEAAISVNELATARAEQVARGAVAYLRAALRDQGGSLPDDSELQAEAVAVGETGYFWLLKPGGDRNGQWAYGVIDEAGKLNLNTATLDMLAALPGMSADLAAGIIDWRDADDEIEEGGAESQYYLSEPQPYVAKNDRFETVEELRSVRGITSSLLYGQDANFNGIMEPWEQGETDIRAGAFAVGGSDRGIAPFVTVYSRQPAPQADEEGPLDVNSAPTGQISSVLAEVLDASRVNVVMPRIASNRPFSNFIDLHYQAGLEIDESRLLLDRLRVGPASSGEGLINLSSAPVEVLSCLPSLEPTDAKAIYDRRIAQGAFDDILEVTEILPREKAIAIGGYITTRTYACSAQIVAASADGRAHKRYLAVFDLRTGTPAVVYFRDMTALGWPLDPSILESLRAGDGPASRSIMGGLR